MTREKWLAEAEGYAKAAYDAITAIHPRMVPIMVAIDDLAILIETQELNGIEPIRFMTKQKIRERAHMFTMAVEGKKGPIVVWQAIYRGEASYTFLK